LNFFPEKNIFVIVEMSLCIFANTLLFIHIVYTAGDIGYAKKIVAA
jgi:hypothetical protein